MHRLRMTALVGVLALSTSGSDSSKTPFQPDLTAFFPKKTAQPTNQKPEYPVGLIETTDIQQRLKQIQQEQSDPFTRLFTPQIETATKPKKVFPNLPTLPVPKPVPTKKATAKVTRPSTKLAEGVEVLGVMKIGSGTRAIVKVPTDGISRYVSEGQQLSDGQVLVKKIEIFPDKEPRVVLSQNGIEISKAVGDSLDATDTIASSTLSEIDSDRKTRNEKFSDELSSNSQAGQSVPSSTLAQIGSDYKTRNEGDEAPSNDGATEPQQVRGQEEYTAAIPTPSPQPSSSPSQKKSPGKVVIAPPANSTVPIDTASVREDSDNSEQVSLNSQKKVKRDGRNLAFRLRHRAPHQLGEDSFANLPDTSSFDLSENQPQFTASSNTEDSTRKQRLVDRLRSGNKAPVGNRIETNSRQALQTDLDTQADQQQPISDQLGYKKPKATSNELTTSSNIEVLAHRQRLINELRRTIAHTNN